MRFNQWLLKKEALWQYDNDAFGKEWNREERERNSQFMVKNQEVTDRQTFVAYHRTKSAEIADKIMKNGFDITPSGEIAKTKFWYGYSIFNSKLLDKFVKAVQASNPDFTEKNWTHSFDFSDK